MKTSQKFALAPALVLAVLVASCANPASASSTPAGKSPVVWATIQYSGGPTNAVVSAGSSGNLSVLDSSTQGVVQLQLPATVVNPIVTVTVSQSSPGYATWSYNEGTHVLTLRIYEPTNTDPFYALVSKPFSFVVY